MFKPGFNGFEPEHPDLPATIFGRTIGMLVVDEAHLYRNTNDANKVLNVLKLAADSVLLMTATPVITKPMVRCYIIL